MDLSKKHVPSDETEVEARLQTPDSLLWLLQAALVARLSDSKHHSVVFSPYSSTPSLPFPPLCYSSEN